MFGELVLPEVSSSPSPPPSPPPSIPLKSHIRHANLSIETEDSFSSLLELAANNDLEGFQRSIELDPTSVDEIGLWYGRQRGSSQMVLKPRTPLMVAATYGSVDVLKLILSLSASDVDHTCSPDRSSALHCATSGGSVNALETVMQLLLAGADPNLLDANGRRPVDVIVLPPKLTTLKAALEELLNTPVDELKLRLLAPPNSNSPPLSSPENCSPSTTDLTSSPHRVKIHDLPVPSVSEKKEYPVDPSLPDIKNSIYSTDEFRMFSFKVRPCSRAYSHDWTECPFVHPGENARRRDPRKFHYSCVPCPDFRKGNCRRGDLCEYAHGVFECWLHPAQYRTRLCKDGTGCSRRVCFFAHTTDELRPLYVSTGSAVPSPQSSASAAAAIDMAVAMSLLPGSPSSVSMMSPSPFTPSMSPSANGISHSSMAWPQPNVPTLHLPGSNLQSSRLRSSLNARDFPSDEFSVMQEFDAQQTALNDMCFSSQTHLNSSASGSRPTRPKTVAPSNLDDLFNAEISSSPRFSDQVAAALFSPSHRSAMLGQFQHQQQSMLSPINTNVLAPKSGEQHMPSQSLLQASFGLSSPRRMSPRSVESHSSMGSRLVAFAQREKQQQQQLRNCTDLSSGTSVAMGSPANAWIKWGSPAGRLDWAVNGDELGKLQRSSFETGGEEPDVSWVQSLVKESPPEIKEKSVSVVSSTAAASTEGSNLSLNSPMEAIDHSALGAWLEQMQLDQAVL